MAQQLLPIRFEEHAQLQNMGISFDSVDITTLTMDSDRIISIQETVEKTAQTVIVDMRDIQNPVRISITADSAIMNPTGKVIVLKFGQILEVFNVEIGSKMKTYNMPEDIVFWKWICLNTVALITASSAYHWDIGDDSAPTKLFDRHPSMAVTNIINDCVDHSMKWLVLLGMSAQNRVRGFMQLHSIEQQVSRTIEGHASAFAMCQIEGNNEPSNLLSFAVRPAHTSDKICTVRILELGLPG